MTTLRKKFSNLWKFKIFKNLCEMLTSSQASLKPPAAVKNMVSLQRDAFNKMVTVPYIKVPKLQVQILTKQKWLRAKFLRIPNLKHVVVEDESEKTEEAKCILLNPDVISSYSDLEKKEQQMLGQFGVSSDSFGTRPIQLTYNNWNYNEILRAILPDEQNAIGGYSKIGHIVHLNLEEELLPYKKIIGDVILDKVADVRTVVNKTNSINAEFRFFEMEVIAGEADFITSMKEHGTTYKMDFSKVYWNPRLSSEHNRIVTKLRREDTVFDVFAGIGPFAVPAAKKGCHVYANDLNPESHKWLVENAKINKVKTPVQAFNLDGREFIRTVVKEQLESLLRTKEESSRVHIVMNLPAMALEFLNELQGLVMSRDWFFQDPIVYCYCFTKDENPASDIKQRAEHHVGDTLDGNEVLHFVRNVAPNKNMYCLQFPLTQNIVLSKKSEELDESPPREELDESPPQKKPKVATN